jgi:uncharacterized coiled-coil DUF342 family protein
MANSDPVEAREELIKAVYDFTEDVEQVSSTADELFGKFEDMCNEIDGLKELAQEIQRLLEELTGTQEQKVVSLVDDDNDAITDEEGEQMYARILAERDD